MNIVSNTSPLIFLTKIGRLDFLKDYKIFIPLQVFDEILMWKNKNKEDYLVLENWINKNNVAVEKVFALKNLSENLGNGERAAISLAISKNINDILIDERKARVTAKLLGLKPKGTIAIIYEQYLNKMITKRECINSILELIKKGYRIKEELIAQLLQDMEGEE